MSTKVVTFSNKERRSETDIVIRLAGSIYLLNDTKRLTHTMEFWQKNRSIKVLFRIE